MKFLILFFSFLFLNSCQSIDVKFHLDDPEKLHQDINTFINSLQTKKTNSSLIFRENQIKWWVTNNSFQTEGLPSIIERDISLSNIKELNQLKIDSLYVIEKTVRGIYSTDTIGTLSNGKTCIGTNQYHFRMSTKNKIEEIIYIPHNGACSNVPINEITGNDYRIFLRNILMMDTTKSNAFELLN